MKITHNRRSVRKRLDRIRAGRGYRWIYWDKKDKVFFKEPKGYNCTFPYWDIPIRDAYLYSKSEYKRVKIGPEVDEWKIFLKLLKKELPFNDDVSWCDWRQLGFKRIKNK